MAKQKTVFVCSNCGVTASKWMGKCSSCEAWNTFIEEVVSPQSPSKRPNSRGIKGDVPVLLEDVAIDEGRRLRLKSDDEMNRVLGGGMVPGSIVLVGGAPGIGKSTLLLQLAIKEHINVLYVSGEESKAQIRMRASRLSEDKSACYLMAETDVSSILAQARHMSPDLLIIDSIQTLYHRDLESLPGTVSQIRYCTAELQQFAKSKNVPLFIIGHITKDGTLAGPKILEHMVDVVLHFEGDNKYVYRILRTIKNRFGSTDEIGIYEMLYQGLRPVSNPSELLLSQSETSSSGSAVAATVEGIRPILIETQALVSNAVYGNPQRNATGFDTRRLGMLLAVLEKKCGLFFGQQDVYLNIAGGIRIVDPAADLAIVAALISSLHDTAITSDIAFAGEVSLSGEIRAVSRIDQRIMEAERMGFKQIIISAFNQHQGSKSPGKIEIIELQKVDELRLFLFT